MPGQYTADDSEYIYNVEILKKNQAWKKKIESAVYFYKEGFIPFLYMLIR